MRKDDHTMREDSPTKNFQQIRDNFYQTIEENKRESQASMDKLTEALDKLVKYSKPNPKPLMAKSQNQICKSSNKSDERVVESGRKDGLPRTDAGLVITENILNHLVRFDIQRRFLNISSLEILD